MDVSRQKHGNERRSSPASLHTGTEKSPESAAATRNVQLVFAGRYDLCFLIFLVFVGFYKVARRASAKV